MPAPSPQGQDIAADLREAMLEAGYTSNRGLAKALQARKPRGAGDEAKGIESWRATVRRYLHAEPAKREVPDRRTAKVLGEILDRPEEFFFRLRGGAATNAENAQLRAELAEVRRLMAERREDAGSG